MIDSSIALGVKPVQIDSPMNALAQALQMQRGMQDNQLGQLKLDEYARTKDRSNKLIQLMQQLPADATDENRVNALKGSGYFDEADKLQAGQLSRLKTTADASLANAHAGNFTQQAKDAEYALRIKKSDQAIKDISAFKSPQEALASLDMHIKNGDVAPDQGEMLRRQIPTNPADFPKWQIGMLQNIMTAKEQMAMRVPDANTVANNATSRANNSATVGATLRGQDISALTAANSLAQAKEVALKANKDEKLTEDQGKATGWLVQAENGYKNIQDALKKDPSASKRGINDTLSDIPSFGAGAALGNSMRGTERQKFIHGVDVISEALLRAATGAGVNQAEAEQKVRELTPQVGDTEELIKQKMDSIPLYIETLKVRAGGGAKKAAQVLSSSNLSGSPKVADIDSLLNKYK